MRPRQRGILIVFEGVDGTGKSTQLALLAQYLEEHGYPIITTREPTEGVHGQKIRQLYLNRDQCSREEELELFLADRRQHVQEVLTPALQQGKIILCDRYYLSTAAYQGANGFDPLDILEKNNFAPVPDIALLFKVPLATGLSRITDGRGEILNDFEQAEALTTVAHIFESLDLPYIHVIDATGSIEAVHEAVLDAVRPLLAHLAIETIPAQ